MRCARVRYLFGLGLLACMAVLVLGGCRKDYLDVKHGDRLDSDRFGTQDEDVPLLVEGMHSYIYTANYDPDYCGVQSLHLMYDMLGDDLINSSMGNNFHISEARWHAHVSPRSNLSYVPWRIHYHLILNANKGLAALQQHSTDSEAYYRAMGELLALRGYSYFQLVQLYGQRYVPAGDNSGLGVIIRSGTEPDYSSARRSTVEEVYQCIVDDLDKAIVNLKRVTRGAKNHINLAVAYGLRARVALVMGQWDVAAAMSQQAIETSAATLQSGLSLQDGFNSITATEWLWGYSPSTGQNEGINSYFAYMAWNYGSTNVRSNPKVINQTLFRTMSLTDMRRQWWDSTGKRWLPDVHYRHVKFQSFKFAVASGNSSQGDFVFMRLAEMYLIRAEALARMGATAEAQRTLTTLMESRDSEYAGCTLTGQELVEEVLRNRRIELWGEGFRFFDLKRLGADLDRFAAGNHNPTVSGIMELPASSARWQFKIPVQEVDNNPLCVQNP